jgi:hypothetical protein
MLRDNIPTKLTSRGSSKTIPESINLQFDGLPVHALALFAGFVVTCMASSSYVWEMPHLIEEIVVLSWHILQINECCGCWLLTPRVGGRLPRLISQGCKNSRRSILATITTRRMSERVSLRELLTKCVELTGAACAVIRAVQHEVRSNLAFLRFSCTLQKYFLARWIIETTR